ncbi:uncharacterized protein LOC117178358 [Belonocnema kinseyi]|uniref:uncharacterized protein LOC117178358 n=1 Tax=Belonocnema kinseyi TaxID=2817044 RepID=UPI00143DDBF5|nr:uncharacterized protein LOC117178358 [Belonocnema kinseyi]
MDGRVAYTSNPGREGYTVAKDFGSISLTYFILKTLETQVERYIRGEVLLASPLHRGQHAFQAGCSVGTALHAAVAKLEQQLEQKGYAVGTFLDKEGAFPSRSHSPLEVICWEALRCGVPNQLVSWLGSMLRRRRLETR